ncbi:MAG: hypothetical protein HZB19_06225 [Chloroflexi bacterium]|nr:hypothetical protein [Chloroflexota bacterium]
MKIKFLLFVLFFSLIACSTAATATTSTAPVEAPLQDIPPTPFPDTPVPVGINAPLIEAPSLQFLDMLNELDGWGMTETQIVRTNDGGLTWYNVTPPGLAQAGYSVGASFLDINHAWVLVPDPNNIPNGGTLYRTVDGGIKWSFNAVNFSGGQMAFLDANNGWMKADLGAGAGSNAVSIFVTQDGGVTWSQRFTNDPNLPNSNDTLPLGGIKGGIVPINMQTAWIGGVIYSPATVYLYRTDDGGVTWSQVNLELPPNSQTSEVAVSEMKFVSAADGFIALRITGEEYRTAFYATHDAGSTWSLLPTVLQGTGTTEFISAQEIVFYNGQQFHVTRDAGVTWGAAAPDVVFGDFFASMTFANASTGWVIMSDLSNHRTLYRSTDGGAAWFPIIP